MLKKTITYQDLDGNPVTEDFYFNLSKAEIAEMELSYDGGFSGYLKKIIESQNGAEIIAVFKSIIMKAVGRRSEDGKRFIKSEEITNDFLQTDAYSQMFMELVTDADAASNFIQGIVPSDMNEAISKGERLTEVPLPDSSDEAKDERPAWVREDRMPTEEELKNMSQDELREAFRQRNQKSTD